MLFLHLVVLYSGIDDCQIGCDLFNVSEDRLGLNIDGRRVENCRQIGADLISAHRLPACHFGVSGIGMMQRSKCLCILVSVMRIYVQQELFNFRVHYHNYEIDSNDGSPSMNTVQSVQASPKEWAFICAHFGLNMLEWSKTVVTFHFIHSSYGLNEQCSLFRRCSLFGNLMGIKERRERDRQHMRKQILDAAMALFTDEGYQHVTMRKIAQAIEYSPGTLYRYFENKDAIYFALRQRGFDLFYEHQMTTRNIEEPLERARQHAEVYLRFALEYPAYYDLMFIMRAPMSHVRESGVWMDSLKSFDLLKEDVAQCMKAGYIREMNLDAAAISVWSYLHGAAALFIRDRFVMHPTLNSDLLVGSVIQFLFLNLVKKPES